ncbi:MAG: porphobilinogen synthase [Alphaproteobacteria bacterium]|nr:porphobilinogen synthase [Alphaproteobacteria bacterium]
MNANPTFHFPSTRLRRLRANPAMRALVQEQRLSADDFILPIFVEENTDERKEISSLPGVFRETENTLETAVKNAARHGIKGIILFGISHHKDFTGSDSLKKDGLMARMINRAKNASPETLVIADACFCEYTDHGHCGPLAHGDVDNDSTLENLGQQAVVAAEAGADIIAPSGMMDGMVAAIRRALDANSFQNTSILSYAVKYASGFYGPFREAAGCSLGQYPDAPTTRKTYQMNPANSDEALREAALDIAEGADMLMVKPGLPYLDIMRRVKDEFKMPLFAYQVSGEYAMMKAAEQKGWLDYETVLMESLMSFKRAGCDAILTYGAIEAARILEKSGSNF